MTTIPESPAPLEIFKQALGAILLVTLTLVGCVTRTKARADAQAAFIAGQQQAMAGIQRTQGASVTIIGPVRNPIVPWTEDMTLAKAILAADYTGPTDPNDIVIMRNGRAIKVDPNQLLNGEDVPLQTGDVVQINPNASASRPR
jgi:protein involved in polysaccharide export with SLBB domain